MWEWKGKNFEPVSFRVINSNVYAEERCFVCGQYFRKGDELYMVCIPDAFRGKHSKMCENKLAHTDHWCAFCSGIDSDVALANKMLSHAIPRKTPHTPEQFRRIEAFAHVCREMGYNQQTAKPFGAKFKKRGSSLTLAYNVYWHEVTADYGGNKGLMGGLYLKELSATVWNKMNVLLGLPERDNFTSAGALKKANELFK